MKEKIIINSVKSKKDYNIPKTVKTNNMYYADKIGNCRNYTAQYKK